MKITKKDMQSTAHLARIALGEGEAQKFADEIDNIMQFADIMLKIDTEGVQPTYHGVRLQNVLREDVVTNSPNVRQMLQNAPSKQGNYFEVPRVVE